MIPKLGNESDFANLISNLEEVMIYYPSLAYETTSESPSMYAVEVVAAFGGYISLFLNLSVISFLELVDFSFKYILAFNNRSRNKRLVSGQIKISVDLH